MQIQSKARKLLANIHVNGHLHAKSFSKGALEYENENLEILGISNSIDKQQTKYERETVSCSPYTYHVRQEQVVSMKVESLNLKLPFIFNILLLATISSFLGACKKLVEVKSPITSLTSDNVYTNDATAASVLTGVYASMSNTSPIVGSNITGISLTSGLSADELTLYGGAANANAALARFYLNNLTPGLSTSAGAYSWYDFYSKMYIVNLALEKLAVSNSLSPRVKQQLTGEAKYLRAFYYFYLTNLFGDVPLITTSDYRVNSITARTARATVLQQVITDLEDAKILLSDGYVAADAGTVSVERVRPNKWAATALLARTYLYNENWDSAEAQATSIINSSNLYRLDSLNGVFLKGSKEAIWQLQPVNTGWNTEDARIFILPPSGPTGNLSSSGYPVYLSNQLLSSFEANDQRKLNWVNKLVTANATFFYPFKYKSATLNAPVTEYLTVLRLGEQYLIRAEARAQLGKSNAVNDLNVIRNRAGLSDYAGATDKTSLLAAILHERQVELFAEWGHRWLDLKRTRNVDAVMSVVAPIKGATWSTNWQLYPIPLYDIMQDSNLTQNKGY